MNNAYAIRRSRRTCYLNYAILLLIGAEDYLIIPHYGAIALQWCFIVLLFYVCLSNKTQLIQLQRLPHSWMALFNNGTVVRFQLNALSQNRKWWLCLSGPIGFIKRGQLSSNTERLQLLYWQYVHFRIIVFSDAVSRQDWHCLKQQLWSKHGCVQKTSRRVV